jgi:hypothetical protein
MYVEDDVPERDGRTMLDIQRKLFPLSFLNKDVFPLIYRIHGPLFMAVAVSAEKPLEKSEERILKQPCLVKVRQWSSHLVSGLRYSDRKFFR